jgi:hypothetical protein
MNLRNLILLTGILLFTIISNAQERNYKTKNLGESEITIDGQMDEAIWNEVEWGNNFTQLEPYEGKEPNQQTAFKILYDDDNIYILVKSYDKDPENIERRMSRRDNLEGDFIGILIDSYNDDRTSFNFYATAAGVKGDSFMSEDGDSEDDTWDPIWYLKTSITDEGWLAEIKIPLTQLRFSNSEVQTWGFQMMRHIFRIEETSTWQPIKQEDPGFVSRYGYLSGIENIKPKKQADILPYIVSKFENYESEEGNFFYDGQDLGINAGIDAKIGLTNNMILDLTVNPDFGQVEADPSEVNLTAFETYFQEKRPFFIEGRNIFDFGINVGDGNFASDNLFYSRRIGRHPHFSEWDDNTYDYDNEYVKRKDHTTILGAMKLTGKTENGLSFGIMESITSKEQIEIGSDENNIRKFTTEPFTNYFAARVRKDLNDGNTVVGAMGTAVNRKLDEDHLKYLHKNAYSGGLDVLHQWKDKKYYINARILYTHVAGDTLAIIKTQRAPQRYFQRPVDYVAVDSSLTQLNGTAGTIMTGKSGSKGLRYMAWISWRSPQFETNDIGFLNNTDDISNVYWAGYRITDPFFIFRTFAINSNYWQGWDFSGQRIFSGGNMNLHGQFKNYWRFGFGYNLDGEVTSKATLRGGPEIILPGNTSQWINVSSDQRKKLTAFVNGYRSISFEDANKVYFAIFRLSYQPTNTLNLSIAPSYNNILNRMQYVTATEFNGEDRYIMADIKQEIFTLEFRANLNLTPDFSIEYYGRPFIFSGQYSNFKRITDPRAEAYADRFEILDDELSAEYYEQDEYYEALIDEDMDGTTDYSFGYNDHKVLDFQSNLVARWEYRPGSVLYLVWSENRSRLPIYEPFHIGKDFGNMFNNEHAYPHDIFLIKLSYRIPLN